MHLTLITLIRILLRNENKTIWDGLYQKEARITQKESRSLSKGSVRGKIWEMQVESNPSKNSF